MTYLVIILALAVGYVMGLLHKGINIHHHGEQVPEEYNSSIGLEQYTEFYDSLSKGVREYNEPTR